MAVSPRRYTPRMPREERREQILDATLRLIAENGFGGVSMEAVAREAEIAKTVVYDVFGDQRGLLTELFEREQRRTLETIAAAMPSLPLDGDPAEILASSIEGLLEAVREHPETWRLILLPADGTPPALREEVNRHRDQLLEQLEPMTAWGIERLGLGSLDPEMAAHAILGEAENAIRLTLTHPRRFPPQRIAAFAADLLTAVGRRGT
ncbi:MAG: TetR/AcrR family transcriptional regulator [Solirubrobacterales bacterium]